MYSDVYKTITVYIMREMLGFSKFDFCLHRLLFGSLVHRIHFHLLHIWWAQQTSGCQTIMEFIFMVNNTCLFIWTDSLGMKGQYFALLGPLMVPDWCQFLTTAGYLAAYLYLTHLFNSLIFIYLILGLTHATWIPLLGQCSHLDN